MAESIDELYERWQRNPDVSQTVALCDALRGTQRVDLVEIVGSHASRQLDAHALLAAARMYTASGRLDDAQEVLLAAGRLAPRDGDVYRWLGEVLLRRGDAERAEKVLERAMQFGAKGEAESWLDRARSLLPTQRSSGMIAVAEEVARNANGAAPAQATQATANGPRKRADSVPDDAETQIRKNDDVKAALAGRPPAPAPAAGRPAAPLPPPALPRPLPPPALPPPVPPPALAAPPPLLSPETPGPPAPSAPPPPLSPFTNAPPIRPHVTSAPTTAGIGELFSLGGQQTATVGLPAPVSGAQAMAAAGTAPFVPPPSGPILAATAATDAPAMAAPAPLPAPPPELPVNPFLVPAKAPRPVAPGGAPMPEARDVLDALQIAGVFEPDGAVKPHAFTWDKPERGKRRIGSYASLIALAVLIIGGASGTFFYVKGRRAKEHLEAEALLAKIDGDLAASEARLLEPSETGIAKAFDLESRSPHAALTWLHERAMVGLLKGGENVAFEDGTQRAKEVGVEEKRLAFAYVASFLFQGDTAGAASALAKWDGKAEDDAWYQLVAGATFERAGDPRALERYAAAVKLDPGLVISQALLARATAVDGDPHHAGELAKEFRAKHPERVEGAALVALAWARDPLRGDPPPEAKDIVEKSDALPVSLRAVPHAVRALSALEQHKVDEAKAALQKGLGVADTPGVAAWLGSIALSTGDEALARKAALAAVSFSAVYAPARVLAARVALLGARLDEALKAAEDLPAASPDVAVVTAAVAYERLDGERMSRALDAMPDESKRLPFLVPLVRGQALLAGNAQGAAPDKALDMSDDDTPWADLVAIDTALDLGDLDLAKKMTSKWSGEPRSMRAVRLARLARYDGRNEDAERFSRIALETGTVTVRVLAERIFVLVATGKAADALALFKTYPNVPGPLAKWLRAYATASNGKHEEARGMISQEDPPPALAPLPARVIAAAAYGAVKDARHGNDYVKQIVQAGFVNPDVATAADKIGVGKITRRR